MSRNPERQARTEAMLGELAELSLMVAKELAIRVRECEDPEQTVALAGAFQKVSRTLRLTLALDAKLERDAAKDAAAEAREARELEAEAKAEAKRDAPYVERISEAENRKRRVSNLLNRLIWNECEGDSEEYEILSDDLDSRLYEAARSPDFETLPVEVIARRVIADMGLTGKLTLSLGEEPATDAPQRTPEPADTG